MNYTLIQSENKSNSIIEQVLLNRGIPQEEINKYIHPTKLLEIPYQELDNIKLAAKTLLQSILLDEPIYVQIDSDCDGYTSASVLMNYLHRIFPSKVENLISYGVHDKKHHGIKPEYIPENVKLVIAPDSSSNEVNIHKELAEKGIKVIVLDHHKAEIDETDPAIIVNNQMCNYTNKGLSGVGIVYKFCQTMDEILSTSYAKDYLDLVALGMIADMMDLRNLETRYYTYEGTKNENIRSPFIKGMMVKNEFKIKNELNPFTVSWYISPFINAMTRSGTLEEKLLLFQALLEYEAYKLVPSTKKNSSVKEEVLVDQAIRVCGNVKNRQEKEKGPALEMIYNIIKEQKVDELPVLIIQIEQSLDNNLNGLLANHIMAEYKRPTFILTKRDKDGVITWEGSARAFPTAVIPDWRKYIDNLPCSLYGEGHPFAFGAGFTPEGLEQFKQEIKDTFDMEDIEKVHAVDYVWNNKDDFDTTILEIAERKDLWGQEVAEPLIVLSIPVTKDRVLLQGKGTLKISIQNSKTNCIKFGFGEEKYKELTSYFDLFPDGMFTMEILGRCTKNEYYGTVSPQIEIKDYNVLKPTTWYF